MADHEGPVADAHRQLETEDKKDAVGGQLDMSDTDPEHGSIQQVHEGIKNGIDAEAGEGYETPDGKEPTEYERRTLLHVGERLPISAFLVAIVELCERFTYYGMQGLFQNYVQRPLDGPERGALGMGHQGATGLTTFFQFWCYVTPISGAIIADQYLGKYNTILIHCIIYMVGLLILVCTSIPKALEHGAGLGGFIVAIIIIGIGTGGIKSNVSPLIADQYGRRRMAIGRNKQGERVIIDPTVTIQRIYMIFYGCINIGSLSLLATPYMERDVGFWSAYLMCLCVFVVGTIILVFGRKFYVVRPPQGSVITDAFKCIFMMIKARSTDAPKPSNLAAVGRETTVPWDDHFVDEVKRALVGCQVFAIYPIYWVVYGQFSSNFVTQASQMQGHGIPNDLMQNFDPIAVIVFIPVMEKIFYPALLKMRIQVRPVTRISFGFVVASIAMAYAAIVQHLIYAAGPCYKAPGNCMVDGKLFDGPNNVHIGIQTPAYVFIGVSEIFASVTGLEYAYTKAPPNMKSFVQSMYLLTNAFGSAIAEALTPAAYDPAIMWMFVGLSVASFIGGIIVYATFSRLNKKEDELNALDSDDELVKSMARQKQAEELAQAEAEKEMH